MNSIRITHNSGFEGITFRSGNPISFSSLFWVYGKKHGNPGTGQDPPLATIFSLHFFSFEYPSPDEIPLQPGELYGPGSVYPLIRTNFFMIRGFDAQRGFAPCRVGFPRVTYCSQPETPARSGGSGPQGFCPSEHESLAIP